MKTTKYISLFALLGSAIALVGCSMDENPVTPNKMQEIRKQEADQRANFNPDMSKPKGS